MIILIDPSSAEAALLEHAVLAALKRNYGPQDLDPVKDTEPHILGRIKGDFKVYARLRAQGRLKLDLLVTIQQQLCLYRVWVPGFYAGPFLSFEDLQRAVAALREPKKPVRKA